MNSVKTIDADQAWLTESVQDFFSGVNWENVKTPPPPLPTMTSGERNLNPNMTVGEFFGAIPWEGVLAIAPLPSVDLFEAEAEPVADDITLDDFFGSF
ncbi:MAG: hypothetical protein VKJ64_10340 [Leptolyngbyaceae bacterium]|nr:hypothetical protein [Leptolyngbyaceae bacterium]